MRIIGTLLILATLLVAAWVEITPEEASAAMQPDSTGVFPFDSVSTASEDTSATRCVRVKERVYFAGDEPFLLEEVGYCVPPDSTRRFFALCSEKARWYRWER